MPIQLIEIPPDLPVIDESRFPDRDQSFIFEHLQHYLSLFSPLPAIGIRVGPAGPLVTRGHKYLLAARALHRPSIRAVIQPGSDTAATADLLGQPDVTLLDWTEIDAAERAQPIADQWHLYFFERPLNEAEQRQFDEIVIGFLNQAGYEVQNLEHSGHRAQFLVTVPAGDESWFGPYRAAAQRFSEETVPVVSFQGRRFGS
jgi:hypothetical protein